MMVRQWWWFTASVIRAWSKDNHDDNQVDDKEEMMID